MLIMIRIIIQVYYPGKPRKKPQVTLKVHLFSLTANALFRPKICLRSLGNNYYFRSQSRFNCKLKKKKNEDDEEEGRKGEEVEK